MKRFLAFGGFNYYPAGGWDDFVGSFGTKEEAVEAGKLLETKFVDQWWHVIDGLDGKEIERSIDETGRRK